MRAPTIVAIAASLILGCASQRRQQPSKPAAEPRLRAEGGGKLAVRSFEMLIAKRK